MHGSDLVLQPVDVQQTWLEVDHIPTKRDELGYPEIMPVGEGEERSVTLTVRAELPGLVDQPPDFFRSQVFVGPAIGVSVLLAALLAPPRLRCVNEPRSQME